MTGFPAGSFTRSKVGPRGRVPQRLPPEQAKVAGLQAQLVEDRLARHRLRSRCAALLAARLVRLGEPRRLLHELAACPCRTRAPSTWPSNCASAPQPGQVSR
jgi:hypothetical protein